MFQDIFRRFRVLVVRISNYLSTAMIQSLEVTYGLPPPNDSVPNKGLHILAELEKRSVFSYDNVDPLIKLLTSLDTVDLAVAIRECEEYKQWADQAGML